MSKDELLDLVNEKDEVIGTVWRSETENNPNLIHREIDVYIFNSKGETLIQQRSLKKKKSPGLWVNAAAGHVGSGEDPKITAIREVKEELGIDIDPTFYKVIFDQSEQHKESRFFHVFYAIYDGEDIVFNKDEVENVRWINTKELDDKGIITIHGESYKLTMEIFNKHLIQK